MDATIFLRLDDVDAATRPVDAARSLDDLDVAGALVMPAVTESGVTGRARVFVPATGNGLVANDIVSGSTLLTRDVSVQAIIDWDLETQNTYGTPGTLIARGKTGSAAERIAFGVEFRVVNYAAKIGEVRFMWETTAGVLKTQVGAHFQALVNGTTRAFVLLTCTRRWVSSSEVVLRYFIGDEMLAEVTSVDGDIGGGTTGHTQVGARWTGAAYGRFLAGKVDEMRVVDRELTPEEVAATWNRITVSQPRACAMLRELHPPGFPISNDLSSKVQRETTLWGNALGFAAGQVENLRSNFFPSRAYGKTLEEWEETTGSSPKPGDSVDRRRARVVGRLRQRAGVSIPGVGEALEELVDTDPSNLDVFAFDQTVVDALSALAVLRWRYDPAAQWTISGGKTRVQSNTARTAPWDWATMLASVGGDGRSAAMVVKLDPTTLSADGEVGMTFLNRATWTGFMFGLRRDPAGATINFVTETMQGGALAGAVVQAALGAVVAPVWLRMRAGVTGFVGGSTDVNVLVEWSTVSADGPFTTATVLVAGGRSFQWAGFYARSFNGTASNIDAKFSDARVRAPYGDRTFRFYVLRDPAIAGAADYLGANSVIRQLRQAHTEAHVVQTMTALYDDGSTTYDDAPMGGV